MKGYALIIDDNALDIKVMTSVLERKGYASIGYTDYKDALRWLNTYTPKIIFLDLQMPEKSGYDLLPLIKSNQNAKNASTVIISSKNELSDIKQAVDLGAADYIVKPLVPTVLNAKVDKIESANPNLQQVIDLSKRKDTEAFYTRQMKIMNMTEFGVEIITKEQIPIDSILKLVDVPTDLFGTSEIGVKCVVSVLNEKTQFYHSTLSYHQLTDTQSSFIKKQCRQLWLETKLKK